MRSPSLTLRLTLAFVVVGLAGAALVAVFARSATLQEFKRIVFDQNRIHFIADVASYYHEHGSWEGIRAYMERKSLAQAEPQVNPVQQPPMAKLPLFALADVDGVVLLPAEGYAAGERVSSSEMEKGTAVWVGGQVVGTVLDIALIPPLSPQEEHYLARNNRALLYAALGASGIALFLGILLAGTLTRPLRELTGATRAMAQGKLGQQVPVRSGDEVGELAAAFNQMSADLARAGELRRQMTADIAHDLRTPLAIVSGYIESLRDGVLQATPSRLEAMYQETQHLQRLVEDLRTLSLADAGELKLNRQSVAPQALLEQLAESYRHEAEQKAVVVQVQAEPELPALSADPGRMLQVLGNLVSNALRYTPAGGRIVLSARARGHGVLLAVQDNGTGITPEDLPHIFDRFYRGDKSRQEQGESGLGLAIARSLVELHGGTITAESRVGEGAIFMVTLPSAA